MKTTTELELAKNAVHTLFNAIRSMDGITLQDNINNLQAFIDKATKMIGNFNYNECLQCEIRNIEFWYDELLYDINISVWVQGYVSKFCIRLVPGKLLDEEFPIDAKEIIILNNFDVSRQPGVITYFFDWLEKYSVNDEEEQFHMYLVLLRDAGYDFRVETVDSNGEEVQYVRVSKKDCNGFLFEYDKLTSSIIITAPELTEDGYSCVKFKVTFSDYKSLLDSVVGIDLDYKGEEE